MVKLPPIYGNLGNCLLLLYPHCFFNNKQIRSKSKTIPKLLLAVHDLQTMTEKSLRFEGVLSHILAQSLVLGGSISFLYSYGIPDQQAKA